MITKSLVSLIAPCYNGEEYVERFIKSVLLQSYKNIQLIFIDDGSIDKTVEVVNKYKPLLEKELTEFVLLKKENGGAASAVNDALKYVRGEYLAWADCDDVLYPDNIKRRVEYLNAYPNTGMVLCGAEAIDEISGKRVRELKIPKEEQESNIFEKIFLEGVPCYPGVFMIRTQLLIDKIGEQRNICFHSEVGQNWQLLLPVAYDNQCGYIQECLYQYYIRKGSHSRIQNYERELKRTYIQEQLLQEILSFVTEEERVYLQKKIKLKYIQQRMRLSFENIDKEVFEENYREFCEYAIDIPTEYRRMKYLIKVKPMVLVYKLLEKIEGRIRKLWSKK